MSDEQRAKEMIVKEQPIGGELAMSADQVLSQVRLVQEIMQKVMKEGEHYGVIPGCGDKPTLLKSGAEKLAFTFRLCPEYDVTKDWLPNGHLTVDVTCRIYSSQHNFLGSGVGMATTMETKHRYRNAALKCPMCGKETIIKGKREYGGGWLCFAKKGGCGQKWNDGALEIEGQVQGKVENPDPADQYNTVVKMGKKRAYVDAILTVTAASDIFTQDIEDLPEFAAPPAAPPKTGDKKKPTTQKRNGKGNQAPPSSPPPAQQQTPPPEPPPARNSGSTEPGAFDDWTVEQCNAVCEKNPVLKMAITKAWNSVINTKDNYCR